MRFEQNTKVSTITYMYTGCGKKVAP